MRYIVDFTNNATQEQIDQYLSQNAATVVQTFSSFENILVLDAASQPPVTEIVESVVNDSENPIDLLSTATVSTLDNSDWWKISSAMAPDLSVPSITYDRKGDAAIVYMVDSGIKIDHPDFVGANVTNLYSFNGDFADYNGHGTALSSVISGRSAGLTDAAIKSVKIFQDGTPTLQSHILAALDSIISDAAVNPGKLYIANMSWTISKNSYIEDKIRFMLDAGIYVIASAGNNGTAIQDVTPASMPEVFTVGSYGQDFQPSDFSNFTGDISTTPGQVNSGALDSWAPGENIRVALVNDSFGIANGTSVAAAIQTATLAFNSHLLTFADGTIPSVFGPSNRTVLTASTSKRGILDLTGQYTGSVNAVATFMTEYDGQSSVSFNGPSSAVLLAKSGVKTITRIFSQALSTNPNVIADLPEGVQIDQYGWVIAEKTVTEPFLWTGNIQYSKNDGTQHNVSLKVIVLPDSVPVNDPSLDPEMIISLQVDGCGENPQQICFSDGCTSGGSGGSCVDACGIGKGPGSFCYCFTGIPNECP